MATYRHLTREQFSYHLRYDPDTGNLLWNPRAPEDFKQDLGGEMEPAKAIGKAAAWNGRFADKPAGGVNAQGYLAVQMERTPYLAHRVAWALYYGECPADKQIDHINGVKTDNRLVNLRLVDPIQNQWNKKRTEAIRQGAGPIAGVKQNAKGRWECRIRFNYQYIYLGTFDSEAEAIAARQGAERAIRRAFELGEGPTHGKAPIEEHPLL